MARADSRAILVTGGAGFIGPHVVRELLRAGYDRVTVLDDESTGSFSALADLPVRCVRADIRDARAVGEALTGVGTVIHLAARTSVVDSIANPAESFDVNVRGSFELLSLAREAGAEYFVAASTGGAILGEAAPPVHEEMPARPASPYGASKLALEGYLAAFAQSYGMRTAALRFSNVYGPGSGHKGSVVAKFFRQIQSGEPLVVHGDGSQVRDFLYVGDLARGVAACVRKRGVGVFQLGSGRPTSLLDLLSVFREVTGQTVPVQYAPFRSGEVRATWCDISKARAELGFSPATALPEGLRATWSWFANGART